MVAGIAHTLNSFSIMDPIKKKVMCQLLQIMDIHSRQYIGGDLGYRNKFNSLWTYLSRQII